MGQAGGPLRTCVGCRQVVPASQLQRYVLVDGALVHDPSRSAPGRGAWLHADAKCLATARDRKGFARSLRAPVGNPAEPGW